MPTDMPTAPGIPSLRGSTSFSTGEIRVAEALLKAQLTRTPLSSNIAKTEAFRSLYAKILKLKEKVDSAKLQRDRAGFAARNPQTAELPNNTNGEAGEFAGVALAVASAPEETSAGDPEPETNAHRRRASTPRHLKIPPAVKEPDVADDEDSDAADEDKW